MEKKLKHIELMEENNLTIADLPKDIRAKINALKPTIARFNNSNPPSEKLESAIIRQDIGISELIADKPDEPVIEPVVAPIVEPVVIVPLPHVRERRYSSGTVEMEKQILEICKSNGYIESDVLAKILGKSSWTLSIGQEEVYSVILRKVYQKNLYKIIIPE